MTKNFKSKMEKISDSINPAKIYGNDILDKTIKYQKIYGFKIGENNKAVDNEADAFRHTYMQAYISLKYGGYTTAKYLGDKHEKN